MPIYICSISKEKAAIISFLTEKSKLNVPSYSSFVWVVNHMNICTLVHILKIIRESLVLGLLEG